MIESFAVLDCYKMHNDSQAAEKMPDKLHSKHVITAGLTTGLNATRNHP